MEGSPAAYTALENNFALDAKLVENKQEREGYGERQGDRFSHPLS